MYVAILSFRLRFSLQEPQLPGACFSGIAHEKGSLRSRYDSRSFSAFLYSFVFLGFFGSFLFPVFPQLTADTGTSLARVSFLEVAWATWDEMRRGADCFSHSDKTEILQWPREKEKRLGLYRLS